MAARPIFKSVQRQPDGLEEGGDLDHGEFFNEVKMGRQVPGWTKATHRSGDHLVTVRSRKYGREDEQYLVDTHKLDYVAKQSAILDVIESSKKNAPSVKDMVTALTSLYGGRTRVPEAILVNAVDERYRGNFVSRHTFKNF